MDMSALNAVFVVYLCVGLWTWSEGLAAYDCAIHYYTSLRMTAQEVHEIGLAEVARIKAEMETVQQKLGHTGTLMLVVL